MADTASTQTPEWNTQQKLAEKMVPLLGTLYREHNVVTSIYGRSLVNRGVIDIIKAHRYARRVQEAPLSVESTYPLVEAMAAMDLGAATIDLAELAAKQKASGQDVQAFLDAELAEVKGKAGEGLGETQDVVLYGFGRIGRLLARILLDHAGGGSKLRLRAVVVRKNSEDDLIKRASLLRRDSIHGPFDGTIVVDEDRDVITANGTEIQVIYSNDPTTVDYTSYGIKDALVVDNTGRWRDDEGLSQHLQAKGAAKVLLTAPGKGEMKNIVFGVNSDDITPEDTIVSAASCTTNGITPVLKVINDRYGVTHGHVETVHSYTNDQNLADNFHKGDRRGRAAGLNMVLTETGAAKAVSKALPEFEGKLTGNAIRVPTPDVSMAVLNLDLEKEVEKDEVNTFLRRVSTHSNLRQQIDYINSPEVVSTDLLGTTHASVVDGLATIASGNHLVLYVWYDNEYGYSHQVVRVVEDIAGVRPRVFPERKDPAEIQ